MDQGPRDHTAYPDPVSPQGQAWAAAGFPTADGVPQIPAVPDREPPEPGSLARYTSRDDYADPPRDRDQVILVTGYDTGPDGQVTVRGFALGFADQGAAFHPGRLTVPP